MCPLDVTVICLIKYYFLFFLLASQGNGINSPLSIYSALALTLAGCANKTRSQLADALHLKHNDGSLLKIVGEGLEDAFAVARDERKTLTAANGIFVDGSFPVKTSYLKAIKEHLNGESQEVNFASAAEDARRVINDWIAANTKNLITDFLLPGSVSSATRCILANAVYFGGKTCWVKIVLFLPSHVYWFGKQKLDQELKFHVVG